MGTADSGKKKIRKIVTILLLLVLIVAAVCVVMSWNKRKQAMNTAQEKVMISTTQVVRMDLSNSISVTGTIESVDFRTISSELKGMTVSEVLVNVGETVKEGQVICCLDSSDLEEELAESRNNYNVNQKLDALKNSPLENYNETVEKAKKSYDSTETTYHTKAAAYEAARGTYEDSFAAACEAFGIAMDSEGAEAALSTAISELNQNDENYQIKNSVGKTYQSAKQDMESAKNSFVSAETAMINAKETYDEAVAKAEETYEEELLSEQLISGDSELDKIESYEEQIEECVIKAPADGVIASVEVKEGDTFSGGTVFTMLDNEHFKVTATVDEYDINSIVLGQKAYVKTNATGDAELPATVSYVAVTSTSGQGSNNASYQIEITLDDAQTLLRTGMTASVSIELEGAEGVLAVPYDCVTTSKEGKSTVTVVENESQRTIEVTKGLETDYYVEISGDGITEGTEVLLPTALTGNKENQDEMGFSFGIGGGMGGAMPGGDGGSSGGPGRGENGNTSGGGPGKAPN
ncbi:MAG: efflux RND transporter periplasmic adaptor subunit [Thermoflexaceae bacterium]|nr:efflux RND transporter periplasmic adaptor subunit [Thermoflexaceae bacterium]